MARPIYETPHDRQRQQAAAETFGAAINAQLVATPPKTRHDYDAFRGGVMVGHIEIKCRTTPVDKYPTYTVAAHKVDALRGLGLPAVIVVRWADAIGWCWPTDETHRAMGGRWDRGDPADREVVAHFPISAFRVLRWFRRSGREPWPR